MKNFFFALLETRNIVLTGIERVWGDGRMSHIGTNLRHHLFTVIGVLALAHSAIAEEELLPRSGRAVDAVVTPGEGAIEIDSPLPLRVGSWADRRDENELREAHSISLELFPQGRMSSRPPFIDFSKFEMGVFVGGVKYSADFEAGINYVLGLSARVPVPGLGRFGLWAEAFISYIERDLPFYYNDKAGSWFGIAAGADYTLVKGELGFIRLQAGVMYAYWNDINSLENGMGIIIGVQFGFYWIKNYDKSSVTITPQFHFDGGDHMIFLPLGISVDF
jgi:hypothetical protein